MAFKLDKPTVDLSGRTDVRGSIGDLVHELKVSQEHLCKHVWYRDAETQILLQENIVTTRLVLGDCQLGVREAYLLAEALKVTSFESGSKRRCALSVIVGAAIFLFAVLTACVQENKTLQTIVINGEIPVGKFRDKSVTELNLNSKGFKPADTVIVSSLLGVSDKLCFGLVSRCLHFQ